MKAQISHRPRLTAKTPVKKPVVSVVVIFHNARQFLREAVESVLGQTYSDWEAILVDDGSDDGSAELANKLAHGHPEAIRYMSHHGRANRGMSASRNLGLKAARGEYVLMLDSDDRLFPDALRRLIAELDHHPEAGFAFGQTQWWYSWSENGGGSREDCFKDLGFPDGAIISPPALFEKMIRNEAFKPCGAVVRLDLAKKVGGFEDAFRGMYEDQVFLAKIALASPSVAVSQPCYLYRKHDESCCGQAVSLGEHRAARVRFLRWLDTYLDGLTGAPPSARAVARSELWRAQNPRLAAWSRRLRRGIEQSRGWLRGRLKRAARRPVVGGVSFGDLARLIPFSRRWGFDRGLPIDRHFIEKFLAENSEDVTGRVLEIGDNAYTRRFGGYRVTRSEVLSVRPAPGVTYICPLEHAVEIPSDSFDCVILTQTLQFIYDVGAAISQAQRILKPGGVLLATVPGITHIAHGGGGEWAKTWYWSFTPVSMGRLLEDRFPCEEVSLSVYGNAHTAAGFLYGLCVQDLNPGALEYQDPDYPLLIAVRARKAQS